MALLTRGAGGNFRRAAGRILARCAAACLLVLSLSQSAAQPPPTPLEYQVKAAFLFNLSQFVEWPAKAFKDATTPFVVGILGEDPFGAYLDNEIVKGEKVGEHPMVVRRFKRAEEITDCHILFVSRSEAGALDQALAPLKGRSVLTVSDVDTFITKHGGMVRFAMENGKIKLSINAKGAKACELTISSKIQSLANREEPDRR